jgi:DNA-directed RNA polymerase I subunit RPA1
MFFMEVIPVAPTRFRPPAKLGDVLFEHPQNELLAKVLNTSYRLRDLNLDLRSASLKTDTFDEAMRSRILGTLLDALVQLQVDVNSFMDSSKNPAPMSGGKLPPAGVKQSLEKKEGLFRKHMMVYIAFSQRDRMMTVQYLDRENVSIMPHALSFLLTSISSQTR